MNRTFPSSHLYNIPFGNSFIDTLVDNIINGKFFQFDYINKNDFLFSDIKIFLPTRRAANYFIDRISILLGEQNLFLPNVIPLGEISEFNNLLGIDSEFILKNTSVLQDIEPVQRRLVLTKFVIEWSQNIQNILEQNDLMDTSSELLLKGIKADLQGFNVARTASDAIQMADALGELIDTLVIHDKNWQDLDKLLPLDLADEYWKISKDFLTIASKAWPEFRQAYGLVDAAERQHRTVLALAKKLIQERPSTPIVIAGSTGSMPATAQLISAISQLPNGAVVFSGLDHSLDAESWQCLIDNRGKLLEPTHPQTQFSKLFFNIGISRKDIINVGQINQSFSSRNLILNEAMLPSQTTERWQTKSTRLGSDVIHNGLLNISIVEADHEREEALVIAAALRIALEIPNKTAAVITPDRSIAERVISELRRWNILAADTGGRALARTGAGSLAILVAHAVSNNFSPHSLLALLNHPNLTLGINPKILAKGRNAIDLGLLRLPLIKCDLDVLLEHAEIARTGFQDSIKSMRSHSRLTLIDWESAETVLRNLKYIFDPFLNVRIANLLQMIQHHENILKKITIDEENEIDFEYLDGSNEIMSLFVSIKSNINNIDLLTSDYLTFFRKLIDPIAVAITADSHPRIKIYGLLEARLIKADLAILAGLDETVWPPQGKMDPFLTREWCSELDLPVPEHHIGQTAHDFVSLMDSEEVVITRSLKRDGSPTVASRFLQRIKTVTGEAYDTEAISRGNKLISLARILDVPKNFAPTRPPAPVPKPSSLPRRLSVTEIETLRRDPYSIYAKHVLKLDYLELVARRIGPSERGVLIHEIFARFIEMFPLEQPIDAYEQLMAIAGQVFQPVKNLSEFEIFWFPSFMGSAKWFLLWDKSRRANIVKPIAVERHGVLKLMLTGGGEFTLTGQADRIEFHKGDAFSIVDFKTGKVPSLKQVRSGFSPQLTLEAAMLKRGAFPGLSGALVEQLLYAKLGGKIVGEERLVYSSKDELDADKLSELHFGEFLTLIDEHWNCGRPFSSRPYPEFLKDYARYDHLARVREWALSGDGSDDGHDK